MKKVSFGDLRKFADRKMVELYESQTELLGRIDLRALLLRRNPYFLAFEEIGIVSDFIQDALHGLLRAKEEKLFGAFLEELAVFTSSRTCGGRKSVATGIDLEFQNEGTHYLVSVKSGPNWGSGSQQKKQEADFQSARKAIKQAKHTENVQPVLGICYGKTRTNYLHGYLKVVGQNFWYLVSRNENLYTDIVEPLGYRAKQHDSKFRKEHAKIVNLFTKQFLEEFCDDGLINWRKLVEFNSGNLDLKENSERSGKIRKKK